jgi:hypothetical protein
MSALRQAIDSVRYERLGGRLGERIRRLGDRFDVRIGGPEATIEGHWAALIVSMIVVFACFFAIGRAMHTGGSAPGEAPSTRQAAPGRVAIPAALAGAPPTEGTIPTAIVTAAARRLRAQPKPRSTSTGSALSASAAARSFTGESSEGTTYPSQSESSGTSVPASAPAPSARPVETRASSPAPAKSEAHSPSGASGGGGSFDTSE